MKKFIAILTLLILGVIPLTVSAGVSEHSYLCTVKEEDLSGESYQLYFSGCTGHYDNDNDAVTVYITNTSEKAISFQLCIGYSGSKERPTTVESGYVKLEPGQTGMFFLENLRNTPEKANDELGYIPGSQLGRNSVVRVMAKGISEGDTFIVCGISSYHSIRDTGFSDVEPDTIRQVATNFGYIEDAKRVIKKEVEEKEPTEFTLPQPPTELVNKFITFTVASAIVCAGGIIIYTVVCVIKRREKND